MKALGITFSPFLSLASKC